MPPSAYQAMKLAAVLDYRRNAGKVQIQRNDCHDNDHRCDQLVVQMRKHRFTAASLAQHINGNGRSKKNRRDHNALKTRRPHQEQCVDEAECTEEAGFAVCAKAEGAATEKIKPAASTAALEMGRRENTEELMNNTQ